MQGTFITFLIYSAIDLSTGILNTAGNVPPYALQHKADHFMWDTADFLCVTCRNGRHMICCDWYTIITTGGTEYALTSDRF
jgi:hypothetical protein